jgi:K+-transporting ATPase KdpF subunit
MGFDLAIGGVIATALALYLLYALVRAERF